MEQEITRRGFRRAQAERGRRVEFTLGRCPFTEAAATDPGTICRLNLSLPRSATSGVLAVQQTGMAGPVARLGLLDHQPSGFQHRQVLAHPAVVEPHVPGQLADTNWPGRLADHLLDWFHLTMRITVMTGMARSCSHHRRPGPGIPGRAADRPRQRLARRCSG